MDKTTDYHRKVDSKQHTNKEVHHALALTKTRHIALGYRIPQTRGENHTYGLVKDA